MKQMIGMVMLILLVIACAPKGVITPDVTIKGTNELKKIENVVQLKSLLDSVQAESLYGYRASFAKTMVAEPAFEMEETAVAMDVAAGGATEFSQTNIQEAEVDEADFMKNDDKYIYTLSGNKLVIIEAFPAEDASVLSTLKIDGRARDMFINGDKLVVFVEKSDQVFVIGEYDYVPRQRYAQKTHALVYDVSDRKQPELVNDFNLNGNYFQARMIGDYVYFITKENIYYSGGLIDMPVVRSEKISVEPEIYYFDSPETNYNFHTITSFDVNEGDLNSKTFMLGYSNNLYVSKNNIYITYQKNLPYTDTRKDMFFEVVVPLLPISVNKEMSWEEISSKLEDMYNKMEENAKKELQKRIAEAVEEYQLKLEQERRKTIVHRIAINNGDIDYGAKGEINGYLLNQFSMSEHNDKLRVATTTYIYRGENTMYNNVYVLDMDMDVVGSLEDIAPDERIYSTRFMGNRLYMVTFKRVDPLFVIDLDSLKILGELKIPGFSDYLHPYDENHIIGIGKETESNEWGGVSMKGVKLSLFDVSDVSNPKQVDKYEIGARGSDSEALHEHKAFLFDLKKNLLVIPVREVNAERYYNEKLGYYTQDVWQGAYVFNLDEEGFTVKGKVSHSDGEERYSYWGSPNAVRRSLYMDDVLYTVSSGKIKANDLESMEEITEVELPYEENNGREIIVY